MKVIYLSPVPLQSFAQRPHHFVHWLRKAFTAEVLWIETPPIRFPRWSDLSLMAASASVGTARGGEQTQSWVHEPWIVRLRLPGLPFEPSSIGRTINQLAWGPSRARIARWLYSGLGRRGRGYSKAWLVVGRPCHAALWLHQCFPELSVVYDVMDDMAAFYHGASSNWVRQCDNALVGIASDIMVSSKKLLQRYQQRTQNCHFVPNGLAISEGRLGDLRTMLEIRKGQSAKHKHPVFGYIGSIAAWFDWLLIVELCRRLKSEGFQRFTIKLIGPIHVEVPKDLPHEVIIKPPISQEMIWDELERFDIALIPFKQTQLTESVDPVKFYEYRAAGLPVLSSHFGDMALRNESDGVYFFEAVLKGQITIEAILLANSIPDASFYNNHCWSTRFARLVCFKETLSTT